MVTCGYRGPYMCETWNDGYSFDSMFEIDTHGAFVFRDLNSRYFSHIPSVADPNNSYFILIEVVPWDSEVYVEYDYGNIDELMDITGTSFESAGKWITSNSENNLGIGNIQTDSTQFKYAYNNSLTDDAAATAAANWKHYAHEISDEAKIQAQNAGYYFSGWTAEYYTEVTVTQNSSNSYNNYTYNLSDLHGTGIYAENDEVILASNVRLTANWEPIELEIVKEVTGLSGTAYEDYTRTYSFMLQRKDENGNWEDFGSEFSIDVTGDGKNSTTISGVPVGTYRVVEIGGNQSLQIGTNPTMNVFISDKKEFVISENITDMQTTVTNTYVANKSIDVIKRWEDNNNSYNRRPSSIIVELLQNDIPILEAELSYETEWKYTFDNLDIYDDLNIEYVYTVREKSNVEGYFLKDIAQENNLFTITNIKSGTIEIEAEDLVSTEKLPGAIFVVEIKKSDSQWETLGEYTTDENGKIIINDLIYGIYKVTEIKAPDGYNLNLENSDMEIEINEANAIYKLELFHVAKTVLPEAGGGRIQVLILIVAIIILMPNIFKIRIKRTPRICKK